MNELQKFMYTNKEIRVVIKEGEPWFVAADVCKALEISQNRNAIARLDDDENNTVRLMDGNPGNPEITIVNEPGLYSLVLGSRKPEAKAFRCRVTHDVIPVSTCADTWFVAADVCKVLEHKNVTVALSRLDEDEKAKLNLGLPGGDTGCVNESGLYALILGSRKPEAKAFKR